MNRNIVHRTTMDGNHARSRGFTLIELLLVIAIISLLLSIVAGAMSGARAVGRRTTCVTRLREIGTAAFFYLESHDSLPTLNNDPLDGHWQYNYVIWDGRDFEHNFGPFVEKNLVPDMRVLYCPLQSNPHHQSATYVNPWPAQPLLDTRAGYGRRMEVTGIPATKLPPRTALYADLFHTPAYVSSGHGDGVSALFTDNHVRFVKSFPLLIRNNMTLPTSLLDNPTMKAIWQQLDIRE